MSRTSVARRFARLTVQGLESRELPANNLTLVPIGVDDSAFVDVSTQGQTITIRTKLPDAILSLTTLQNALSQTQGNRREVIVTTEVTNSGVDGNQAGNIVWDANGAGSLNFTGFDSGKLLTFQTVSGTIGNIDLTAVAFQTGAGNEQISLKFDATGTNGGTIGFRAGGAFPSRTVSFDDAAVVDLTVLAGPGGFTFEDADEDESATAGGNVAITTTGPVSIAHAGGITAFGDLTVTGGSVALSPGSGLLATGNLAVTGTTAVTADTAPLTAENGSISVTGGTINLSASDLSALATVTVNGAASVDVGSASVFGSGDASFTSSGGVTLTGLNVTPGGKLTVSGADVQVTSNTLTAGGDLSLTGSASLTVDGNSVLNGANATLTSPGPLVVADADLFATGNVTLSGLSVALSNGTLSAGGNLGVTATDVIPTVQLTDLTLSANGNLSVTGAVELGGTAVTVTGAGRDSALTFDSTVNGTTDLTVSGGTVSFGGDLGATTPLGSFTLARGVANLGTNDLSAATVFVGDGVIDPLGEATLGGRGVITVSGGFLPDSGLVVSQDGNLAPGGLGTVGTLAVQGNVVFDGGDFAVDLGPTSDLLRVRDNPATPTVEGNVTIQVGRLGGGLGTGALPDTALDVQLIDFVGLLTGEFFNAPLNVPVLAGTDAIQVTNYGPAALGVTVSPVAAVPGGVFVTADPEDGTLVTAKLTGGGQLVGGQTWDDQLFLVARNTTPVSILSITTLANGGDTVATFGAGILVNGPLASLTAPRINVGDQLRATGAVKVVTIRDLLTLGPTGPNAKIEFGGLATSPTSITTRNVLGSVQVAGVLTKLSALGGAIGTRVNQPGLEDSSVSAASIGTITGKTISAFIRSAGKVAAVTATGDFRGGVRGTGLTRLTVGSVLGSSAVLNVSGPIGTIMGTGNKLNLDVTATSVASVKVARGILGAVTASGWNVTGGVVGLTAAAIDGLNLTAKFAGVVKATGTPDLGGFIRNSTFILTGNDGTAAKYGLKSLTAAGTVSNSKFDVKGGNVGPVRVGRFHSSRLYLNYTPAVAFNTGGAFGAPGFRLTSFVTTAIPTPNPNHPLQWAFQDSEVAADSIGTVTLSGLNSANGGTAFGVKVQKGGTVLVVKAADPAFPANRLNTALNPSATPYGADFYFLRV